MDFAQLVFPTTLRVDYVRVYQDPENIKTSCDPPDAPTAAYIEACVFILGVPRFEFDVHLDTGIRTHTRTRTTRTGKRNTVNRSRGTTGMAIAERTTRRT